MAQGRNAFYAQSGGVTAVIKYSHTRNVAVLAIGFHPAGTQSDRRPTLGIQHYIVSASHCRLRIH